MFPSVGPTSTESHDGHVDNVVHIFLLFCCTGLLAWRFFFVFVSYVMLRENPFCTICRNRWTLSHSLTKYMCLCNL